MMTLKKQYKLRQLANLNERIKQLDKNILFEEKTSKLIIEAINEDDLKKISTIIDKLRKIKHQKLPTLSSAIEQAESELNKYTAGGPLVKAWTKLKNLAGIDNPIVKIATFANALEKGFSQIPIILKNNGIDTKSLKGVDLDQTLSEYITTKMGQQAGADKIDGKLKDVVDQLRKALSPDGIFGVFKKVPYVDGDKLTQELVNAPLNVFSNIVKTINKGTKTSEIASQLKTTITGQGNVETKGTTKSEPTTTTSSSVPTTGNASTTASSHSTATGERPRKQRSAEKDSDGIKKAFSALKDADIGKKHGVNDGALEAILSHLSDNNFLR